MQSIPPFGAWGIPDLNELVSGKVVEAQPWQAKFFQQSLLYILSLKQSDLFRFHFATILRQLAVDFTTNAQHLIFYGVLCEGSLNFFIEDGKAPFKVLEVDHRGGVEKQQDRRE